MLVTLAMLWCLGQSCEVVRVSAPAVACALHGQLAASQWQREHPAYAEHRLAAWRCEMGERV